MINEVDKVASPSLSLQAGQKQMLHIFLCFCFFVCLFIKIIFSVSEYLSNNLTFLQIPLCFPINSSGLCSN